MRTLNDMTCAVAGPSDMPLQRRFCGRVARLAVGSLYAELALYPKPGLVSLVDNGSHTDMDAATFLRSLFALRHYFRDICQAGMEQAPFATLRQLGIDAERRMLQATGGVNTHRGAIFSLGLLCAAAGRAQGAAQRAAQRMAQPAALGAALLREHLLAGWGDALGAHSAATGVDSHGLAAAANHGASGAREEGARGLPSVFQVGLVALRGALAAQRSMRRARIDTLFALMAHISDTNVVHRGGAAGAALVRTLAQRFVDGGGTGQPDWMAQALHMHRVLVAHKLSPGGAADLLAASCFVHALTVPDQP